MTFDLSEFKGEAKITISTTGPVITGLVKEISENPDYGGLTLEEAALRAIVERIFETAETPPK